MTVAHVHDDVCAATRVLGDAGLLPPNLIVPREHTAPCPCCNRATATDPDEAPSECTSCRMAELEPAVRAALGIELELFVDLDYVISHKETAGMDLNEQLAEELKAAIAHDVANKPRSLQVALGPSEVGEECQRKLAYKLLDWDPKPNTQIDPLPSFIGTAAHEAIAAALEKVNERHPNTWIVEKRVHASQDLSGRCDAYHIPTGTTTDHKFVGPASMRKYRDNGPSRIYRVQVQLYALGWEREGYTPRNVAIAFYPRGGRMEDLYIWTALYDRQVALDALERIQTIRQAIIHLDPELHPERWAMFPTSASHACTFCEWWKPDSADLSKGCPSEPGAVHPRMNPEELIA